MNDGKLTQVLRPIKIAFIVDYCDNEMVMRILKINSTVWGGHFNPIIPFQKTKTGRWRDRGSKQSMQEMIKDYISNYDPDYIVDAVGGNLVYQLLNRSVISIEKYERAIADDFAIGTKMDEIYHRIIAEIEDASYLESYHFVCPAIKKNENEHFLTAIFGQEMNVDKISTYDVYRSKFNPQLKEFSIKNYLSHYNKSNYLSYRNLTSWFVKQDNPYNYSLTAYFVLNSSNVEDVMEFWNLRANGWFLVPIPISEGVEVDTDFTNLMYCSLEKAGYTWRKNLKITILKSGSIDKNDFNNYLSNFDFNNREFEFTSQLNFPRLWTRKYWAKDHVVCVQLESDKLDVEFDYVNNHINFAPIKAGFTNVKESHFDPKYAIDIRNLYWYSDNSHPSVFPKILETSNAYEQARFYHGRISRNGFTVLRDSISTPSVSITMINSKGIFNEWAKIYGYDLKISAPGKITYRMYDQFENSFQIRRTIGREGTVQLLDNIPNEGIEGKALEDQVLQILKPGKNKQLASDFIYELVDYRIIQGGFGFKCPECGQKNWYSLIELKYKLDCRKCLYRYKPPTWDFREFKINYRTVGTFSLPRKSYGVYPVILTYMFFKQNHSFSCTSVFSFDLVENKTGKSREIDLAMFVRRKTLYTDEDALVLVETKTFMPFKRIDITRMKSFGKKFKASILVFATLNKSLQNSEKKLIRELVSYFSEKVNDDNQLCQVMILTANELLTYHEITWDMSDLYRDKYNTIRQTESELSAISKVTQLMYLN